MTKRRILSIAILVILVICVTTTGVLAYMFKHSDIKTNGFDSAKVDCEVIEVFQNNSKTSVVIKNTGDIPAYVRVRFISYWVDSAGNRVYNDVPDVLFEYNRELWLGDKDNNTYYYRLPVNNGDSTQDLLQTSIDLSVEGEYYQVVEIVSEAIQSEPVSAVQNAWNIELSSDGSITGSK